MTPRVLLTDTSRWPAAARIAIGLARAGIEVSAVCPPRGHPLHKTSFARRLFPYSGVRPLHSLLEAIHIVQPQLIIPCDERTLQHLHELYRKACSMGPSGKNVADLIERSLGSPDSYPVVSSRCDLLRIASEEGVPVPETNRIATVEDLKRWQGEMDFPWVMKADGTSGGRGVRIADSRDQAEEYYLEFARSFKASRALKRLVVNRDPFWLRPWWQQVRSTVSLQAYIRGRPANCAAVCWEGKVLGGIAVEVVSSQGVTEPANVVRVVNDSEMMIAAERIARRLRLSGFFGLDFMIENATGVNYLIEMNPRCTPLCHLQLGRKRDMVGALAAQLLGQKLCERPPLTDNDLIAFFPQAWHVKSEFLEASFQDIPQGEPELVRELLDPSLDRRLIARAFNRFYGTTEEHGPKELTFVDAMSGHPRCCGGAEG